MKNKTLVVIDYQNDFVKGSLGSPAACAIMPNVKAKIEEARKNGDHIIFTHDTHYDDYLSTQEGRKLPVTHCIDGTPGWEIAYGLDNFPHSIIRKTEFGSFGWIDLITKCEAIEIIGVVTDICVVSNALILRSLFPEIEITVDASCCAGSSSEAHNAALTVMKSCQINVIGE